MITSSLRALAIAALCLSFNAYSETILISWVAPTEDIEGEALLGVGIEYAVKAANAEFYTEEQSLNNYTVIESGITDLFYELTHSVDYCFYVHITATRTDVGAESDPSGVVEWCPGSDPETPPYPQPPEGVEIRAVNTQTQ